MIEAVLTFDLLPNVDMKAYQDWLTKLASSMAKESGIVEFRANRNVMGDPMSRAVTVFRSLEDWAKFTEGPWQTIGPEFRQFATHIRAELWGPSPQIWAHR